MVDEAAANLGGEGTPDRAPRALPVLAVAVNADSLATWILPALARLADRAQLRIHREDESRSSDLLRDGTVLAAVTTQGRPVAGCRVTKLGIMRYRPVASPGFVASWFPDGPTPEALDRAPVVTFDASDPLQDDYLRRRAGEANPPRHRVPSSVGFVTAITLGMGWGMVPELQAPAAPSSGLVEFDPGSAADVVLYWQRWSLDSPTLELLTGAVESAARAGLLQQAVG